MIGLLVLPSPGPEAMAWLAAILAAVGGVGLHLLHPPRDPVVADAILQALVHP